MASPWSRSGVQSKLQQRARIVYKLDLRPNENDRACQTHNHARGTAFLFGNRSTRPFQDTLVGAEDSIPHCRCAQF